MENVKPWQIILIIAALAACGYMAIKFTGGSSPESQMADSMMLVDVETGQLFEASLKGKRGLIIPAQHPNTGVYSLMPVYEENDEWFLRERYYDSLSQITVEKSAVVGEGKPLKVLDEKPIKIN